MKAFISIGCIIFSPFTHLPVGAAGIFISLAVDGSLGFLVLLFWRLTMMRDQKMELWHAL
jgi:hypothetical protein